MQLFIHHDIQFQSEKLILKNATDLIRQIRKVLRASNGYIFCIQNNQNRRKVQLDNRNDRDIFTTILQKQILPNNSSGPSMAIALPNKQEKLELIVQKLAEIGIGTIYLRSAQRSVLKELSSSKFERITKIAKEATEQSRGWRVPQIKSISSLDFLRNDHHFCFFDLKEKSLSTDKSKINKPILGIIGPEGGLTDQDYPMQKSNISIISLGETVLRMETAAIVGGRILQNNNKPEYGALFAGKSN